jgi:hypothetical protein
MTEFAIRLTLLTVSRKGFQTRGISQDVAFEAPSNGGFGRLGAPSTRWWVDAPKTGP